jgi:hypothetical protein
MVIQPVNMLRAKPTVDGSERSSLFAKAGNGFGASADGFDAERGQVLPFVAVCLMGAALFAVLAARSALTLYERQRAQTAADSTALAAATGMARGLNVAAVSNQYLLSIGLLRTMLALMGNPTALEAEVLRKAVVNFQNRWVGLDGSGWGPRLMEGTGKAVAELNGMDVIMVWNGASSEPSLNLERMGLTATFGSGGTEREKGKYSYRKKGGGSVDVPEEQVESVTYERGGKKYTQYRMKDRKGGKAGRFVKKDNAGKGGVRASGGTSSLEPLTETEPVHTVLVIGRLRGRAGTGPLGAFAGGSRIGAALAEAGGGGILGTDSFDDPNWDARLVPLGEDPAALVALLQEMFPDAGMWEPGSRAHPVSIVLEP